MVAGLFYFLHRLHLVNVWINPKDYFCCAYPSVQWCITYVLGTIGYKSGFYWHFTF